MERLGEVTNHLKKNRHLNIIPPTLLLAISALMSSLLGIVRDRLLARNFGAGSDEVLFNIDIYHAAFKIPDLLYFVLISGAISASFIPLFTQYKKDNKMEKAWAFASNMLHLMLVAVSILALIAFIFAPQLTRLVASGFEPDAFDMTVRLMRIMLLSPIIFTFSAVFMSLQDSFKTFFYRSLFPLVYNLGIIISILFFTDQFGVVGLTWGVILGALLATLIQLPALKQIHFKHFWTFDFKQPDVRQALTMMLPRVFSTVMFQLSQIAYTLIASFLATGSIAILYFANNIYSLPLSMIAVAFSITTFATFSELATESSKKPFALEIKRVMQQILFLVLPATMGLILLREPLIDTLLVVGKFNAEDAMITSNVLIIMLLSLFTHSPQLAFVSWIFCLSQHDQALFGQSFWSDRWGAFGLFSLSIARSGRGCYRNNRQQRAGFCHPVYSDAATCWTTTLQCPLHPENAGGERFDGRISLSIPHFYPVSIVTHAQIHLFDCCRNRRGSCLFFIVHHFEN